MTTETIEKPAKQWARMTAAEKRNFRLAVKGRAATGFGDGLLAAALLELADTIRETSQERADVN